jgi:hypothetical protein
LDEKQSGIKAVVTYFHPRMDPQVTQKMSQTVCRPVVIIRSSFSPTFTFTLETLSCIGTVKQGRRKQSKKLSKIPYHDDDDGGQCTYTLSKR